MRVVAILRQVPDVVEELVIAKDGRSLSEDDIMYITNEADEHALEQALILKARHGASVVAISAGGDEAREALATAVAKGADEAVFAPVPFANRGDNEHLAALLSPTVKEGGYDLVLTGVWALDQLDAGLGGLLAANLSLPYIGGLASVAVDPAGKVATVRKELPGGRLAVLEVSLPAVLGVQSAEQPPRYVPVSRVVQARKALKAREIPPAAAGAGAARGATLLAPEAGDKAEMIPGEVRYVADYIIRLLKERGVA